MLACAKYQVDLTLRLSSKSNRPSRSDLLPTANARAMEAISAFMVYSDNPCMRSTQSRRLQSSVNDGRRVRLESAMLSNSFQYVL